jgi:hypothetical protein
MVCRCAGSSPASGTTVTVTNYGGQNKKAFNVKYIANDDVTKDEAWAIKFPIGLIKTYQPLTITVQDTGSGSGIGHQYTCLAKSKPNDVTQSAEWTPECFFFGSAGKVGTDLAENFNFYFMAPSYANFPTTAGKEESNTEYLLYLGISEFNMAMTEGGLVHDLAIEVTSSSTVRWCLPGDAAYRGGAKGCDEFSEADAQNFYDMTTADRLLNDATIFPTQAAVDGGADRYTGGQGGMVNPFLSLEDINTVLTRKAQECYGKGQKLNPVGWKCEV